MCLCFYTKKLKAPGKAPQATEHSLGTENEAQKRTTDPLDISFVRMICGCFFFLVSVFISLNKKIEFYAKKKKIEVYLNRPA